MYYETICFGKGLLESSRGTEMFCLMYFVAQFRENDKVSEPIQIKVDILAPFKLPSVALPKFDGQLLNGLSCRDMYEAMVHNNPTISKIHKF